MSCDGAGPAGAEGLTLQLLLLSPQLPCRVLFGVLGLLMFLYSPERATGYLGFYQGVDGWCCARHQSLSCEDCYFSWGLTTTTLDTLESWLHLCESVWVSFLLSQTGRDAGVAPSLALDGAWSLEIIVPVIAGEDCLGLRLGKPLGTPGDALS